MPDSPPQLAHLEPLGDATRFASQMHALIPRCALLENFSPAEVLLLAHFMEMYRAEPGVEIIQEGDGGDFMLMVVEGKVAVQPTLIAVLHRESLARIIVEQPLLGAKILMELVLMLSQRLRATSQRLLGLLDGQSQGATDVL